MTFRLGGGGNLRASIHYFPFHSARLISPMGIVSIPPLKENIFFLSFSCSGRCGIFLFLSYSGHVALNPIFLPPCPSWCGQCWQLAATQRASRSIGSDTKCNNSFFFSSFYLYAQYLAPTAKANSRDHIKMKLLVHNEIPLTRL